MVRIVSWNVNGIRTLQPSLKASLDALNADIICLQETKISSDDVNLERYALVPGYHSFFSFCTTRSGYSGTAVFSRVESKSYNGPRITPINAGEGFDNDVGGCSVDWLDHFEKAAVVQNESCSRRDADRSSALISEESLTQITAEGRVVITDHGHFVCINIYAPAVSVEDRVEFKASFNAALELKVRALRGAGRNVVIVGDFNIRPGVLDGADAVEDLEIFNSRPARSWLRKVMLGDLGLVDTFREMNPLRTGAYTCWSEATRARENNHGARIDLMVVNRELYDGDVSNADILSGVMGSDHCPITLDLGKGSWAKTARSQSEAVVPPQFCTKYLRRFETKQSSIRLFLQKSECGAASRDVAVGMGESLWSLPPIPLSPPSQRKLPPRIIDALDSKPAHKRARSGGSQSRIGSFFRSDVATGWGAVCPTSSPTTPQSQDAAKSHRAEFLGSSVLGEPYDDGPHRDHKKQSLQPMACSTDAPSKAIVDGDGHSRLTTSEAKLQWRRLLPGPPPPPLCRHREPCTLKSVKKSGENRGRTFYSCARSAGSWPSDPSACCNYFKWAPFQAGKLLPKQ